MIDLLRTTDLACIHHVTCWPQPRLSVIVKGVFDLVADGVMARAVGAVHFGADEPLEGVPGRLRYATDLAPRKFAADVLLVGAAPHEGAAPSLQVGTRAFEAEGKSPFAFAPIAPEAPARQKMLGTYDERWLAQRWPWFPEDFDPRYFSAAPPAMQVEGYLRGDEKLVLQRLLAGQPRFVTHLPGLRPRCFRTNRDGRSAEIAMRLDTMWIDATAQQASLLWRGITDVASEDAEDVKELYLAAEHLVDPPGSEAHHDQQRQLARLRRERAPQPRREPAPPRASSRARANDNTPPVEDDREALAELSKLLKDVRLPPEVLAAVTSATSLKGAMDSLQRLVDIDPVRARAILEDAMGKSREVLAEAGVDQETLDMMEVDPFQDEEPAADGTAPAPVWTRERVQAAAAAGESMEGVDLRNRDLSDLELSGAKLRRALLQGTRFQRTNLSHADLTEAVLARADLTDARLGLATLEGADLTAATAEGVDLVRAKLGRAVLDQAVLRQARLDEAEAGQASFRHADLSAATLTKAKLGEAVLTGAVLDRVDATGASLASATLEAARGERVCLAEADLTEVRAGREVVLPGADLRSARGDRSIWMGADLQGATLSRGSFVRADLSRTNLSRAKVDGANCENADLTKSDVSGADLQRSNFAGACLDSANLEGADARRANLYEAELWRARTAGLALEGAHVAMTKLAKKSS